MSSLLSKICQLSKKTLAVAKPRKGFFTFLFFLVLSGAFWLSTAMNETYDEEVAFPLRLENVPQNVVITDDFEDTLRVVLHDKGFNLLTYMYGDKVKPIVLNFNTYARSNGKVMVASAELHKLITQNLHLSTTITAVKPEKLEFTYSQGASKRVPVVLAGKIFPAENYYLSQAQITPQMVTVFADRSALDSITEVKTEDLTITNLMDTLRCEVNLKRIRGAKIVPKKVSVLLYSDILTESSVEVPIKAVNVPEGQHLRTFPLNVKVKFHVGVSQYRNVNASSFVVEVDYNEIEQGKDKCPIRLTHTPDGVTNAVLEFEEVDYLIEK